MRASYMPMRTCGRRQGNLPGAAGSGGCRVRETWAYLVASPLSSRTRARTAGGFAELVDAICSTGRSMPGPFWRLRTSCAGQPADQLAPEAVVGAVLALPAEGQIPELGGVGGESGGAAFAVSLDGQDDSGLAIGAGLSG